MNALIATRVGPAQSCAGELMFEAQVVVFATGHTRDGVMGGVGVKRLQSLGLVAPALATGALDTNAAEELMVAHTREVSEMSAVKAFET